MTIGLVVFFDIGVDGGGGYGESNDEGVGFWG